MKNQRHNYRTDLLFIETFYKLDESSNFIVDKIPSDEIDFEFIYSTGDDRIFSAGRKSGVFSNCERLSDSSIIVYIPFSRKCIGLGYLVHDLRLHTPNKNFPEGIQKTSIPHKTGIFLWEGPSDVTNTQVTGMSLLAQPLKGDPGISPKIIEFENTASSYRLRITTADTIIDTPNLRNDDTAIRAALAALQSQLNTLVNGDVNGVIDAFNEIEIFLAGITDAQTLTGILADLRREVVAQIPTKAATPTTPGLMSAADKTKLDGLSSSGGGMKPLVVEVLPVGGVIGGGKAYYSTSNSSYAVTGRVEFPDDADMSTITVPANISVTFNYMFKAQKDMSTVSGTSSQYKQYTIQRVPMPGGGARSYIYLVNCSIYG